MPLLPDFWQFEWYFEKVKHAKGLTELRKIIKKEEKPGST